MVQTPLNNDQLDLIPRTTFDGPSLVVDLDGLEIGVAEYDEGPTGCTVFLFPDGAATAIDIRGGMVGTIGDSDWNHAICLAGGSLYGLEAAAGVRAELFAQRGFSLDEMALVSGAIIYDYGARASRVYPDLALGRAAVRAALPGLFPLGRRGAGRSARCGGVFDYARTEPGGQGAAVRTIGQATVAVFVVVNALGIVLNRDGSVARGNLDPGSGVRLHPDVELEARLAQHLPTDSPPGNTTLTVVVTNQRLDQIALQQLSRQVHSSMTRAIQPFHTRKDGDVLFAVTTAAVEELALSDTALALIASDLAWDAVLSAVAD